MTNHEPLLSDLCRICNTDIPKYRCPRCSVRTCSVKCSKRHKLWSQCSGVRDPAAYIKRSELATPAGIDRDFNFLAGIERGLEKCQKECETRGIDVAVSDARGYRPLQKGEYHLRRAMESSGVIISRAPKGMQRSRENLTQWNKKQRCLAWTVEWFHDNGQRKLFPALENSSVTAAYSRMKGESQPTLSKKRKLDHKDEPEPAPTADEEVKTAEAPAETEQISPPTERWFFLLRPRTPGSSRVLISLSDSATLSESLRGREVLEFPTIYVLPEPPSALPPGFILESQYLSQSTGPVVDSASTAEAVQSKITPPPKLHQEAIAPGAEAGDDDAGREPEAAAGLNEEKILDVLYKDLGASPEGN